MIAPRETLTYYETCSEKIIISCLLACMGKWRRRKEHGSIFLWALDHHLDPTPAAPSIAQTTKFGLLRFRPRSRNRANPCWDANCPDHARPHRDRSCICKLKWKYPIIASFPQCYIDWAWGSHLIFLRLFFCHNYELNTGRSVPSRHRHLCQFTCHPSAGFIAVSFSRSSERLRRKK